MSQTEIKLFDDSVIKLTIKQGTEQERFLDGATTISGSSDIFNANLLDFNAITSVSGSLSSGELGWTRDTHRLFVGNISEQLKDNSQQTLGGVLSGNKYLGYIDSRKNKTTADSRPEELSAILAGNVSDTCSVNYRSYNFTSNNEVIVTEDRKWAKLPYYNETYDAYDGDYVYDIYRNALIIFDHNIKRNDSTTATNNTVGGKRKTPLQPFFEGNTTLTPAQQNVYDLTSDMFGDGYFLLYNVIPDGETLTFKSKKFKNSGEWSGDGESNFNYNIITINSVPLDKIKDNFNSADFNIDTVNGKISLKNSASNISITNSAISNIIVNEGNKLVQSGYRISDLVTNSNLSASINAEVNSRLTNYYTKGEVDNKLSGISSGDTNITIGDSFTTDYPDYGNAAVYGTDFSSLTINQTIVDNLWGFTNDEGTKVPYTGIFYILVRGTAVTLTHSYTTTDETDAAVPVSKTLSLGSTTILLPAKISQTNEQYRFGGTITSLHLIPSM